MDDLSNPQQTVVDFGIRIISDRNSSKIIALPKTALSNLSEGKFSKLNVKLVQQSGEKYLKLTPVVDSESRGFDANPE